MPKIKGLASPEISRETVSIGRRADKHIFNKELYLVDEKSKEATSLFQTQYINFPWDQLINQPIEWSSKFEVGIPEIDSDHSALVTLLNDLGHAIRSQVSDASQRRIATDAIRFLLQHFKREEVLLARHQHPLIAEHLQQHDRCAAAMIDLEARINKGLKMSSVAHFLHDWIVDHITDSDRELFCSLTMQTDVDRLDPVRSKS